MQKHLSERVTRGVPGVVTGDQNELYIVGKL